MYVKVIVYIFIATSKQRTSLRRAVASDKKKIMECITQYNTILTELHPSDDYLSIEEVMDGKFPWSAITGDQHNANMYYNTVRQQCVAHNLH